MKVTISGASAVLTETGPIAPPSAEEQTAAFSAAKEAQRQLIRDALATNQLLPVYDPNLNAWWNGGIESSLSLDGARRLSMELGLPTVTFYDAVDNTPHALALTQASMVVYLVAGRYQADYAHKQAKFNEIDAASTVAEVQAVVW